ncbi:MAG: HAMP domain-containing histidine kinase [Clostridia bacterium]|nr:HAMP domain-containing histidine kinase [Clostridia bacterium]
MKRKWHIRKRIFLTLTGLTCTLLLVALLAFNLSVRGYIRSRVSAQLGAVSQDASRQRREEAGEPKEGRRFDEHSDRITGTQGNALILSEEGELLTVLHGDEAVGRELASYFSGQEQLDGVTYKVVDTESGSFAVSAVSDPVKEGQYLLIYVDVTSLLALTHQINLVLLIVIFAAILLSVFLSRRFSRSLAEPVQDLSDFAAEIGSGNLATRRMDFRDVEFERLAESMNRMAAELQEAKQKQETFFQNVSHELRTPLTSIRGNAEGIVYEIMEPKKAAGVILSESDKLGGMVEDILYLSRMGKGKAEGAAEPLDLREVLSLCVSEQDTEVKKKGLSFQYDFDEEPVLLPIREQDAERLFGNLLSNAVRYARKEIRLGCHRSGETVTVSVADDGSGIAPEDLPHIFERFYKGKDGKHGIGLAIAESVVKAYGGELRAESENGAKFEAVFPTDESPKETR